MKIAIGAVGTLRKGPEADLVALYRKRFQAAAKPLGFRGLEIFEVDTARNDTPSKRLTLESEALRALCAEGDNRIFVLDEGGTETGSRALADRLAEFRDTGIAQTWFLIGGADGHGPAIRELLSSGGATAISFGKNTWPHMLVRVMLCEQIYRAATILANHPYHRA